MSPEWSARLPGPQLLQQEIELQSLTDFQNVKIGLGNHANSIFWYFLMSSQIL